MWSWKWVLHYNWQRRDFRSWIRSADCFSTFTEAFDCFQLAYYQGIKIPDGAEICDVELVCRDWTVETGERG